MHQVGGPAQISSGKPPDGEGASLIEPRGTLGLIRGRPWVDLIYLPHVAASLHRRPVLCGCRGARRVGRGLAGAPTYEPATFFMAISTGAVVMKADRSSLQFALRPVDTGQGLDPDEPLNQVESGR